MLLLDAFSEFDAALEWQVPDDDPLLEPDQATDSVAGPQPEV